MIHTKCEGSDIAEKVSAMISPSEKQETKKSILLCILHRSFNKLMNLSERVSKSN